MVIDWIDPFPKGFGNIMYSFLSTHGDGPIFRKFFQCFPPCKVEATRQLAKRDMTRLSCHTTERRFVCLFSSLDEDTEK